MRWPWRRGEDEEVRRARLAAHAAERALRHERQRLEEVEELAQRLASHRQRNRFAEAMRQAFTPKGGHP